MVDHMLSNYCTLVHTLDRNDRKDIKYFFPRDGVNVCAVHVEHPDDGACMYVYISVYVCVCI